MGVTAFMRFEQIDAYISSSTSMRSFMGLPAVKPDSIDYSIIGVPFDTACTHRAGSRFAPSAIREMSAALKPYNLNLGIDIKNTLSGVDLGDINVIPGYIEDSYERIEAVVSAIVNRNIIPVCLGGDHSITLGQLRAVAKKHGRLALVHYDSHMDTVNSYLGKSYNHATTFRRAFEEGLIDPEHSIQIGIRSSIKTSEDIGIKVITADMVRELGIEETGRQIRERVGDRKAFCSFDIDVVDPAYAPGTGTMEVGGFTSYEALHLIRQDRGLNIIGFDVVEVLPAYDSTKITALLAANIVHEFLGLIALNKINIYRKQ